MNLVGMLDPKWKINFGKRFLSEQDSRISPANCLSIEDDYLRKIIQIKNCQHLDNFLGTMW